MNNTQAELLLIDKFPYYRKLTQSQQEKFMSRLMEYMASKKFVGRKELVVTNEMRVLISASAVQVTFGLDDYIMDNFPNIYVYPAAYKSGITGKYHKGEVNLAGIIALSWPHFTEGYAIPDNNSNLGLHEMAHAVRFAKFKGDYDQFFSDYFDKWTRIAKSEFEKVRDTDDPTIFREYAGTNMNEFFAVCTEHFFETPATFKQQLPELYHHTCILLNQDPVREPVSVGVRDMLLSFAPDLVPEKMIGRTEYYQAPLIVFGIALGTGVINFIAIPDKLSFCMVYLPVMMVLTLVINQFLKRLIVYDNAIVARHPLITPLSQRRIVPFEHVLSAELREEQTSGKYGPSIIYTIEITYLWKGRTKYFITTASAAAIRGMGEYLHKQHVAVKVFNERLRWY
jgi:Mlc titration factor MtfA (ptsG expression regulator)